MNNARILHQHLGNATLEENVNGFEELLEMCQKTLNHHASTKSM